VQQGGSGLIKRVSSMEEIMRNVYPDYDWQSSKFYQGLVPKDYWRDERNLLLALERAEQQIGIQKV